MKLRWWMAAKAVVEIVFGIGFVVLPLKLASLFGMELDTVGALMAQLFGTAFIFGSILLWLAQTAAASDKAVRAIVTAVVISNAIGFVVTLIATINNVWNALGWLPVCLYLIFFLGFAYYLFNKKAT